MASKYDLDNSSGTATTTDSLDEGDDFPLSRPSVVICEDDQADPNFYHNRVGSVRTFASFTLTRDSISIDMQRLRKINDDEIHEVNSHLEDFLIPRHVVRVERSDETEVTGEDGVAHGATLQDRPKNKVRFGSVLRRDYDIILGDHPSSSFGIPLTISWDYTEYEPLDIDAYEFHRPPRRSIRDMQLSHYQRLQLLLQAGFTTVDINRNRKQVNRAQRNRSFTSFFATNYPLVEDTEAVMESACRKFKRLIKKD
ncbi:hypothetical protein ACHAW5_001329 [Stephanodiscus triporus]|uniref:Uncharacterized protein n=1 Tax=Stephanodiscus triporus TaxID=2934178 RepID=A0ABD3NP11_9STRA